MEMSYMEEDSVREITEILQGQTARFAVERKIRRI